MADQIFSSIALNTAVQLCAEIRAGADRSWPQGFRLCIDIFDSAGVHGVFHMVEKAGRQRFPSSGARSFNQQLPWCTSALVYPRRVFISGADWTKYCCKRRALFSG